MKSYVELYVPTMRDEVINLKLRQADILELLASTGTTPSDAIDVSLEVSEIAWVIKHEGKIEGVFGLSKGDGCGIPWLLLTDKVNEFRHAFLKYSWDVIEIMLSRYEILTNFVDSRHTEAIKWLKWLGFTFTETEWFLHDKSVPFRQFVMYRRKETSNV